VTWLGVCVCVCVCERERERETERESMCVCVREESFLVLVRDIVWFVSLCEGERERERARARARERECVCTCRDFSGACTRHDSVRLHVCV